MTFTIRTAFASACLLTLVAVSPGFAAEPGRRPVMTLEIANRVAAAAVNHARSESAPGAAIAIVDDGGSVVAVRRLDGTFPAGPDISIGKARTAASFRKPTRDFEELVNKGRTTMVTLPGVTHFTPLKGGVPLAVDGQVIGAIGVSGAASADQDDEIASFGAQALAAIVAADGVQLYPKGVVAEAFTAGRSLEKTDAYRVEASRRDGPGKAEVHLHDTDIFYVVSGRATVVTGGTVIEPTTIAPGEIRGTRIEGGTERLLEPGSVITIANGTPHWFRDVSAPMTYLVVKSTDH